MPTELNIGANLETPKIESKAGALNERPDLVLEKQERSGEKKAEVNSEEQALAATAKIKAAPVASVISEYEQREKQIENFLARGLEDIYLGLPLEKQVEFRRAGEETAKKINKLLENTKVNLGKIVSLIRKWLMIIPGVNKYFLEQEAKIKSDEIIKLKNNR